MEISQELRDMGWHLTDEGIKKIIGILPEGSTADAKKIVSLAKDMDFKEICGGALPTRRDDSIPGRIVLQLQKVRNLAAPKANEESKVAPRMLQLELSDGQSIVNALELEPISAINLNLPPGTKIHFRAERLQLMQGYIILNAAELQVLDGRVESLVEKWEMARTMAKYVRSGRRMSGPSGPPPWLAFGKKMDASKTELSNERNFKSLQAAIEKDKESKENDEFNTMRSEAIAEATKAGVRKIFGGGGQQILDHNVKKILEKGYSEDEAKQALRSTNNNLERAFYNLKRRQEHKRNDDIPKSIPITSSGSGKPGRGGLPARETSGKGRGSALSKDEAAQPSKPASNVSLFDFLTGKLPSNTESATQAGGSTVSAISNVTTNNSSAPHASSSASKYDKPKTDSSRTNYSYSGKQYENASRPTKFENNISSSFAANRSSTMQRGGTNNGRSGDRPKVDDNNERNLYSTSERSSSYRYSSGRGGGSGNTNGNVGNGSGRGGRGNSSASYGGASNSRGYYEEGSTSSRNYNQQRTTDRSERSNTQRNSNSSATYNPNNRSNRSSNERASGTDVKNDRSGSHDDASTGGGYDSKRNDYQSNRYGGNFNDNKNYERPRYGQRDNNGSRQSSKYNTQSPSTSGGQYATNASNNNHNTSGNKSDDRGGRSSSTTSATKSSDSVAKLKAEKPRESGGSRQVAPASNQSQLAHQSQHTQPNPRNQHQYSQPHPLPMPTHSQAYVVPPNKQTFVQAHLSQMPPGPQPTQAAFAQLPNGYTYDPSKIIGFQNRETNEYAMNMMKSQGFTVSVAGVPQPQPQGQPQQYPQPNAYAPAASPMQPSPSPFGTPNFVMATAPTAVAAAPPPPAAYGMIPADTWMWKIGDLCLAKYWDDGSYYEAKITAISDNTIVVFFLGYGNHEEVLKSDCLPITEISNRPIFSLNPAPPPPQVLTPVSAAPQQVVVATAVPAAHPMPNNAFQRSTGGSSQRYRGERQVYVPPHKREN